MSGDPSSAAATSSPYSDRSSVPWQVQWKNPTWEQYASSQSSSPAKSKGRRGRRQKSIVEISTAQVFASEIAKECPEVWSSLQAKSLDGSDEQFLLTVTLLDPSGKLWASTESPVATEVMLELSHCSTQEILLSRNLVWPETIGSATRRRKQAENRTLWTDFGEIFLPWLKVEYAEETMEDPVASAPSDSGVVSATLCRQPVTKQAQREEALEVISYMMGGLGPSDADPEEMMNDEKPTIPSPENGASSQNESDLQKLDSEKPAESPLSLACISSHGLICIYSLWDLLSSSTAEQQMEGGTAETQSSSKLDKERAMASWLLGSELFQQLESAWLPLSRPKTTISLSILNDDWNKQKAEDKDKDEEKADGDSGVEEVLKHGIRPLPKPKPNLLVWNPWVEASSLSQRTVYNRATSIHVVSPTFPYLVILGQGIPFDSTILSTRSRKTKRDSLKKENGHDLSSRAKETKLDISSKASTGGSDSDWWKDSEEWDPFTIAGKEDKKSEEDKNWWENDDAEDPALMPDEEKKQSNMDSPANRIPSGEKSSQGGFVTFCSMVSWAESKTVFLDFVPCNVTHVEYWHEMELLVCIGEEKAVAIRLDSASAPVIVGLDEEIKMLASKNETNISGPNTSKASTIPIHRYQILPIELQMSSMDNAKTKMNQKILCAAGTVPPSLLQLFTEFHSHSEEERGLLVMPNFRGISAKGSIQTTIPEAGRVAQLPSQEDKQGDQSLLREAWGYLGQGWSLFGTRSRIFFLCWEGATPNHGIFLRELHGSPTKNLSPRCVSHVLSPLSYKHNSPQGMDKYTRLPFSERYAKTSFQQPIEAELESADIVAEAMHSISSIRLDATGPLEEKSLQEEDTSAEPPLSHQEKSERLLRHLSSWTQLEDTEDNREWLERQVPVIAVKSGLAENMVPLHVLNFRQVVIENRSASPFFQVLGWLSQKQDYFTAASIALDLLRDPETLYHLWKNAEKIDEEDEQTKLKGLLDGIIPISMEGEPSDTGGSATATLTQLADMTIGCLVKGGLSMAKTLSRFLQTNQDYDPARASLMLVAAIANTVSGDDDAVSSAMGIFQKRTGSADHYSISDILWPMKCLLEIGAARECLEMDLNLLNATIPDELRRRPRQGGNMTLPHLELTKAMVTMIVSCDPSGAALLLALPTERSDASYWESLDGSTQEALALIEIQSKYPMLFQEEVREWTRSQLHSLLKGGNHVPGSSITIDWLRELSAACLFNAGCDLQDFILDPTNMSMISVGSENSTVWADLEMDGEDGLFQHKLEIVETRNALEPAPESGGLDLDLLISSLLLLRGLQESWRIGEERLVSTQSLLDAACYLAGRPNRGSQQPRFGLNTRVLMQQCALSGNVRAGANLIGGKDGFVLCCCDIMMLELQVSMEDAETFFLGDHLDIGQIITQESSKFQQDRFELTDSHRQLLWLLDEHVLSIRTYGDFEADQYTRGRVDPVFAARSVFRGWLCLTYACRRSGSDWMCRWLSTRLGLEKTATSRHRLACAAIVRALIWPSDVQDFDEESMPPESLLGRVLNMDKHFLIRLAQSSCGLVESIPLTIAEGLIELTDATQELSTSFASMRISRTA